MKKIPWWMPVLLVLCQTAAAQEAAPPPPAPVAEKPAPAQAAAPRMLKLALTPHENGRLLVAEIRADQATGRFIVDSGAAAECLFAKAFALRQGKQLTAAGEGRGIVGKSALFTAAFDSVEIGEAIKLRKQTVAVADLPPHLQLSLPGQKSLLPDGLLGAVFLERARAVVCYPESMLLIPPGDVAGDAFKKSRVAAGDFALPLTQDDQSRPFIEVKLKGQSFLFLVDTAAGANVLLPEIATELGLAVTETKNPVVGGGHGELKPPGQVTASDAVFGGILQFPTLPFLLIPDNSGIRVPKGSRYGGIIGAPLLKALRARLDFGSYRLLVPHPEKKP